MAIGRRPKSENLGLRGLDIAIDDRGFIMVDQRQRTTAADIFAVGDVTGNPMLDPRAAHQGKIAAENAAGHERSFSAPTIPSVAYTNPELAWVGLTEKEAQKRGIGYDKGKFIWGASGRALTAGAGLGSSTVLFASKIVDGSITDCLPSKKKN